MRAPLMEEALLRLLYSNLKKMARAMAAMMAHQQSADVATPGLAVHADLAMPRRDGEGGASAIQVIKGAPTL